MTENQASANQAPGGLKAAMSNNATIKPNSDLLETLRATLPQFFEKDTVDDEGNVTGRGAFKSDKFLEEIKTNNIAEARDGYKLGFVGKDYARLQTGRASETVIVPDSKHNALPENKDSGNVFITGDNIDALRHLVNAYENQIKLIYIDPPYNTGKEFVYSDKFEFADEKLTSALGYTDAEIARLKSIQGKSSHSAWLTFMYPRLKIAQKLLTPDGVIFVSIDDNEQANLKLLMDDVFGEGNFVGEFVWKSKLGKVGTTNTISTSHEYILCYAKGLAALSFKMIETENDGRKENLRQWGQADRREDRPSMYYPIEIEGVTVYPIKEDGLDGRWRVGKETAQDLLEAGSLQLVGKDNRYEIYRRFDSGVSVTPYETLLLDDIGTTAKGAIALKNLELDRIFDYSKPVDLIKHFLQLATNNSPLATDHSPDLILDFFAGSATTAHAVMQLNAEDGGHRKYIMVQWDEQTNEDSEARKAGYKTIDQISRERIKRAGAKILKEYNEKEAANAGQLALADETEQPKWDKDIGFKHYRLVTPNVKTLDRIETFDPAAPVLIAEDMLTPFARPDTETSGLETLLTTWLIDDGFTFDTPIETLKFAGYSAHLVQSKLYLIAPDWGSEQTKELLNRIGTNTLNVQHVVVYAYSFLMESLRELEINIKNTLDADHQVYVERRY
jgi:adenine-specific DNA-methyltransferase